MTTTMAAPRGEAGQGREGEQGEQKGLFGKIFGKERKRIRKAKMGQEMQMYYHEELKCWVMPGEEAAKKKEVEALRAPPVMPGGGGMAGETAGESGGSGGSGVHTTVTTSTTSTGATKGLASRYAAMPTMAVRAEGSQSQSLLAGLKPPSVGALGGGGMGQFQPMQPMQPGGGSGGGGTGYQNVWAQQRMKQREGVEEKAQEKAEENDEEESGGSFDPFVLEVLSFWSYYREAGYDEEGMVEWVGENYGEDVARELDCEALLRDVRVAEAVATYKATHMNEGVDVGGDVGGDIGGDVGGDGMNVEDQGAEYVKEEGVEAAHGYGQGAEDVPSYPPEDRALETLDGGHAEYPQTYQPEQEYGYETPVGLMSPADQHRSQGEGAVAVSLQEQDVAYTESTMYDQPLVPEEMSGADVGVQPDDYDQSGVHDGGNPLEENTSMPCKASEPFTPTTMKLQTIAMKDHIHMESHLLKVIDVHSATIEGLKAKLEAAVEETSTSKAEMAEKIEELRQLREELDSMVEMQAKSAAEAAETEQAAQEAANASLEAMSALELRLEKAQEELAAAEAARSTLETEKEARDQHAVDLESDVLALREQVAALEEEKAALGRDGDLLAQQQEDMEKLKLERDELSEEANRLREALAASEEATAVAVANAKAAVEVPTQQSGEMEELLGKLSALEEEKGAMQEDFQNMLDERDAEIMQLEARVMLSESAVQSAKDTARAELRDELRDEIREQMRDEVMEEARRQVLEEMAGEKEQQMMLQHELEALAEGKEAVVAELAGAEERIQELERKFTLAKKKIHAQTGQIEKLQAERQELLDRDQTTGHVDEEVMNELESENASLKATIEALELRMNDTESTHEQEISNLMKENDQLMDALSEKEDHLEMVTTELAQLRAEAETQQHASQEVTQLHEELSGLQDAVALAESALKEEQESREAFRAHVETEELRLYDQIRELEDQVSFLKETLTDAQENARVATEEVEEARAAAEEARRATEQAEELLNAQSIDQAVDEATKKLNALLEQRMSELVSLQESIDGERMDREVVEEDLRRQVAQLEEQFSFVEESASLAQQALMEERGAKDMANAQCLELTERLQDLLAQVDRAQHEAQEASEDAIGLREELERVSQSYSARETEMAQLKATLADYESSLQDANETLENAQRDIAELTDLVERSGAGGMGGMGGADASTGDDRVEELEREISSLKHQLASLSESASGHQDEVRKYKLQLVKAKKLRAADQEKIEELQNNVDELNEAVAIAMSTAGTRANETGDPGAGGNPETTAELDTINQELESSLTDALTALGQEEAKVVRLIELLGVAGLTEEEIHAELDAVAEEVGFGGDGDDNDALL